MKNLIRKIMAPTKYLAAIIALLGLLMCCTNTSWGQQVIGSYPMMDGGFEGQTVQTVPDTDASATTPTTNWTKGITSTKCTVPVTTAISNSGARTGSKYAVVNVNCPDVSRQLISPQLYDATTYPKFTDGTYTFQYWVRNSSNIGASGVGVGTATAVGNGTFVANTTSTWTKQTVTVTPNSTSNLNSQANFRCKLTSAGTGGFDVDDVVVYFGAADGAPPVAASGGAVSGLNVSWTASSNVDGGGYMVVRYATIPQPDNDPNENGIYAVGNTIISGVVPLTGTVVFIGTGTSFTDAVAGSTSGSDYYKVYAVDKAFNYATEIVATAVVSTSPAITSSIETLTGFNYTGAGPSASQSFVVSGSNLTNDLLVSTASTDFELSSDNFVTAGASSISLSGTTVASTTLYVRLKANLLGGAKTATVTIASTGANTLPTLSLSGSVQAVYYYNGSGLVSSNTSWGSNSDGTGANPSDVTATYTNFVIANGNATTNASWTLGSNSKVIVGNGASATLTVANTFPIIGTIDAAANGSVVWQHVLASPTFGTLDNASEVHFAPAVAASYSFGASTAYGKLFIDGVGEVSVSNTASTPTVKTALTVASGSTLSFSSNANPTISINSGATATINGKVITFKATGLFVAGGSIPLNAAATLVLGANSTMEFGRPNSAQTVTGLPIGVSYANLILSDGGASVAAAKTIAASTVNGTLTINLATPAFSTISGANNITLANGASVVMTSGVLGATPTFAGTVNVTYNGTGKTQIIGATTASSTNVTLTSSNAAIVAGMTVTGTSLAAGTTVASISGTTLVLSAAASGTASPTLTFGTAVTQTTGLEIPSSISALNNLIIENAAGVTLGTSTTINGTLTLTKGKLTLPASGTLQITSGNAIVGGSSSNYIVADPSAVVTMDAIASERLLPIGNATKYLPVTITPASTESLNISVFDGITGSGTFTGTALGSAQKTSVVDAVWNISQVGAAAATNSTVKVEWPASLEGADYTSAAAADLGLISNSGTGGWNSPTGSVDKTNRSATATVTSFGSFSAGRAAMLFAQPATKTYGDTDFSAGVTSLNTSVITYASIPTSVATIDPTGIIHIVGAGTATITASQASDGVYAAVSVSKIITVNKKSLTITAANKSKYVGQTNPALTVTYSNDFITGESATNLTTAPSLSTTAITNSVVGTYSITASGAVSDNYSFIYIDGTLTVNPKLTQTISFSVPATKVYGDADIAVPASSDNNTIAITYSSSNTSVATIAADGTLHIVGAGNTTITASQAGDATYDAASNAKLLTVNKATLTITAENKTRFISQPNPALTVTYAGFVLGESETNLLTPVVVTTTALTNSDPGNYPITTNGATAANYDIIFVNGTLTIMTAPFEFYSMPAKTYGDADFNGGATSINTSHPIVYVSSNSSVATIVNGKIHIVGAGTTDITASQLTDGYYPAGNITRQLLVNKAASGIVFGALATKIYGNADYTATATSANGEQAITYASSNPAVATISSSGNIHIVGAGVTDITVSQSGNSNYLAESVIRQLTVSKAALTITADDKAKYEGQANPALTATYTGFVLGEAASVLLTTAVITTTSVTASVPATYPINVSGATASNYAITFVSGSLLVNAKLSQTITFAALATKTYGNADFATGGSSTNASIAVVYTSSNTAVATIVGTNVHIVGAGTADITASQAGSDVYAAATSVVKTLTVSKAALKITADNKSKTTEQVNPVLTVTYTGFVLSETSAVLQTPVVISTTAVTASLPGTYPITASAAAAANYTISFVAGTLTVNPKTVQTISFAALAAKMYGNADFAAGGTSNNATLPVMYSSSNQGVATIIGNMIHIMGAGTTVITASQNGDALYYPALNVSRTLTVSKVPLTIKAIDTTKIQGEDNPVFAFTYTGLVAGETGANLFSKVSTSALKGSAAGHYSIAPTGADTSNYIITYVSGRFTIYPPAGKDQINLNAYRSSSSQLTLQIYSTQFIVADAILYNLNGTPIKSVGCNVPKGFSTTKMDLPFLLPGLYIIKVKGWSIDCKKIISIL